MNVTTESKLIDAVRDRPELWDKRHPDFKNQIKKTARWVEVEAIVDGVTGKSSNV